MVIKSCISWTKNPQTPAYFKNGENVFLMQDRKFHLLVFNTRNRFPGHPFTLNLWVPAVYSSLTALFPLSHFKAWMFTVSHPHQKAVIPKHTRPGTQSTTQLTIPMTSCSLFKNFSAVHTRPCAGPTKQVSFSVRLIPSFGWDRFCKESSRVADQPLNQNTQNI